MKRLSVIIFSVLACLSLSAQKPTGTFTLYPRVGFNMSKFSGDKLYIEASSPETADVKYKAGFTAGAEVQYQMSDILALSGGLLYSRQGTKFDGIPDMDNVKMNTDNINVPVLLVATSNIGLNFKLGLQPEFRVSDSFNKIMNRVTLSIPIGLSYDYRNFELDVRYNFGLTSVYKGDVDNAYNRSFMLTLSYGIDL
jgi:opacity protein-like surface antigen